MALEDIRDAAARHLMTEIRECTLYPQVTPIAVFLRHSYNQLFDLLRSPGPVGTGCNLPSYLRAISLRCQFNNVANRSHIRKQPSPEQHGFTGQAATLIVRKAEAPVAEPSAELTVLLAKIVVGILLLLVHPARQRNNPKAERVQRDRHRFQQATIPLRRQRRMHRPSWFQ